MDLGQNTFKMLFVKRECVKKFLFPKCHFFFQECCDQIQMLRQHTTLTQFIPIKKSYLFSPSYFRGIFIIMSNKLD